MRFSENESRERKAESSQSIIDTSSMSVARVQLLEITSQVPEDHVPQITKIITTFDGVERRAKPRNKQESGANK
ncbi:MAG: hypothetical protein LZF61_05895 [Nitrosomonas sp.]|nr:MAG: hypothetical protein LZF61_05895 [Nitrosomonas sp.]